MPNDPLKTFRAVEPANWGFGASATIASKPFVLQHVRSTEVAYTPTGGTAGSGNAVTAWASITSQSFTLPTLDADRTLPWVAREKSWIYPVSVPNAYDRVYIFPVYMLDRVPLRVVQTSTPTTGTATTTVTDSYPTNLPVIAAATNTYTAPTILPYGMFPETRGSSAVGGLLNTRLPDDLITASNPRAQPIAATRTYGLWNALMPYASNFNSGNGGSVASSATNPVSLARYTVPSTSVNIGAGYQLPNDLSVSPTVSAATAAMTTTNPQFAVSTSNQTYLAGLGLEFSLQGCSELVVTTLINPTGLPTWTASSTGLPLVAGTSGSDPVVNGNAAGTYYPTVASNYFLMGVFLG